MRNALLIWLAGVWLAGCTPSVVKQSALPGSQATTSAPPSQSYTQTPDAVAHAAIAAMSSLGWDVDYAQGKPPSLIEARTPLSLWTGGDRVQAIIGPDGEDGKTTVHVISRTDGQVYDWGKNEENIRHFFGALDSMLALSHGEAVAGAKFSDVVVTAGPISQPYKVLGEVYVDTRGMLNFGSALNDALFRSPLAVAAGGRTPVAYTEQMNKFLNADTVL